MGLVLSATDGIGKLEIIARWNKFVFVLDLLTIQKN